MLILGIIIACLAITQIYIFSTITKLKDLFGGLVLEVVRKRSLMDTFKRTVIGLGPIEIAPGASADLSCIPTIDFKGNRIIATSSVNKGLYIEGLLVDNKSQLPTHTNPISLECFDGSLFDNEIPLDLAKKDHPIVMRVKNTTKETAFCSASLFGIIIDPKNAKPEIRA